MLAACAAAALLCVNTASAQSCPYRVAPGQTLNLAQASTGSATSLSLGHGAGLGVQVGSYDPSVNQVGAFAQVIAGVAGAKASAYGQINFQFCVQGNSNSSNSQVNANISANVNWVGVLYGVSVGSGVPSVTGTLSLVDKGTDGKQNIVIMSSTPLSKNLGTIGITVPIPVSPNFGYSFVTGSAPAPMIAPVIVGHAYEIQYNLDCEAPSGIVGLDTVCNFILSEDIAKGSLPIGLPVGNYNSTVDSLQVTLDQDLYGMLVAIKSEVDGLQAQVAANRQAIAAANLIAEQEDAQLLGILNEIKSLLSAKPADPPVPTSGKAKTGDPKPPIRPVRPAAKDPP